MRRPILWLFCAFFGVVTWATAPLAQSLDYQRIQSEGIGPSYDEALKSALAQAVGQVNGVEVAQRVATEATAGSAMSVTNTQSLQVGQTATRSAGVGMAVGTAEDSSGNQSGGAAAAIVIGEGVSKSVSISNGIQVSKKEYQANKTVVDTNSQTQGIVNRYQVVSSEKRDDGWHVLVLADIGVYKPSDASERLKFAIAPFRLDNNDDRSRKFASAFRAELINRLTQSGRLAILDRDFTAEDQAELNVLTTGNARKDQMARLGNALGADYLIVGTINEASIQTASVYMQSIGKTITGTSKASVKLTYRLVEVATGQIHQADGWTVSGVAITNWDAIASTAATEISQKVIEDLFPVRIERVAGGVFYIGQGGEAMKVGQKFRVVQLGQVITDSYTHEVIGREENDLGTIEVFEVEPKLAKARMVAGSLDPGQERKGTLVARLVHEGSELPGKSSKALPSSEHPPAVSSASKDLLQKEQGNW